MQVAEVVAQVLLQAQTDVLIEVAADPASPPRNVESQVAQVGRLQYMSVGCFFDSSLFESASCCP